MNDMTKNDDEIKINTSKKIEDEIKQLLINYLVIGGMGRHRAEELAKVHISGLVWANAPN